MSASFEPKGKPTTTCVTIGGRRKHHTSWEDGSEMVEEYDVSSNRLVLRKMRNKSALGKLSEWRVVLGEPEKKAFNPRSDLIASSTKNPVFIQQDTPTHFMWRIRNIPYERSVYRLTIDSDRQQIVLRTTNKKYFKRISVPQLQSVGDKLSSDPSLLTYTHDNDTLIIQYKKSPKVIQAEADYAKKRARDAEKEKRDGKSLGAFM
uniref:Protein DPCD n=1 Tax=Lotharella oceanica TaxID=641309 RepID=A0A7S2U4T5_9EUKA